jgi:hypothetical protein
MCTWVHEIVTSSPQVEILFEGLAIVFIIWRTHAGNTYSNCQAQLAQRNNGPSDRRFCISPQLLDGLLDNSRRPLALAHEIKLLRPSLLDDRRDYRQFFTYWIHTVQV